MQQSSSKVNLFVADRTKNPRLPKKRPIMLFTDRPLLRFKRTPRTSNFQAFRMPQHSSHAATFNFPRAFFSPRDRSSQARIPPPLLSASGPQFISWRVIFAENHVRVILVAAAQHQRDGIRDSGESAENEHQMGEREQEDERSTGRNERSETRRRKPRDEILGHNIYFGKAGSSNTSASKQSGYITDAFP